MPRQYDLQRFVDAQQHSYADALAEVRRGRKRSHWMWYVFPQLKGLGRSSTAERYAIADLGEAGAYLAHPLLGPRLTEISQAACDVPHHRAIDIFGSPDDLKLRSSATLFRAVDGADPVFQALLDRFYDGSPDPRTLELLAG
ncbi:MAG: DUF1810 domain-containing protein [Pseudomonadota bacterium]